MSTRSGLTLLGFGKHAAETYENARVRYPSYLSWLRTLSDPSRKQQAWLSYCSHAECANPQTPKHGSNKRARVESIDPPICRVHGMPMEGPRTVRNGQPHNIGRQFYKCAQEGCGLAGFLWADGTAAFSEPSVRRAERHYEAPEGSMGVGPIAGSVADYLDDGSSPVWDDPHGKRARTSPAASSSRTAPLIGQPIAISGLVGRLEFNGKEGIAESFNAASGRYNCSVSGQPDLIALKPANVRMAAAHAASGPAGRFAQDAGEEMSTEHPTWRCGKHGLKLLGPYPASAARGLGIAMSPAQPFFRCPRQGHDGCTIQGGLRGANGYGCPPL